MKKNIEKECAEILIKKGLKVTTAESCTGGLISKRLTDISGSSAYFDCGFITYSDHAKISLIDVPRHIIEEFGAVSSQTAVEMAKGALRKSGADIALAVTGIAGPSGGSAEKPIGTVFIAIAFNGVTKWKEFIFSGKRSEIREKVKRHRA